MDNFIVIKSKTDIENLKKTDQQFIKLTLVLEKGENGAESQFNLTPDFLNSFNQYIAENGSIEISLNNEKELSNKISTNLKFAGYIRVKTQQNSIIAYKKSVKKDQNKINTNVSDLLQADKKVELVMENELIDPFNTYQKFAKESDCITKPKPCKNCTCGRASENNESKENLKDTFKPECGKCYLGDAFRCEGCPYRGTPAFNPGDKIEISSGSTQTGIKINSESEKITVNVQNGSKVTLDI